MPARLSHLSDDALVALVQSVHPMGREALGLLVERHQQLLRFWAWNYVYQAADAEDAFQSIAMHVIENLGKFQPWGRAPFRPWLATVAYHKAISLLRARTRRSQSSSPLPDELVDSKSSDDQLTFIDEEHVASICGDFALQLYQKDGDTKAVAIALGTCRRTVQKERRRLRQTLDDDDLLVV